MGVRHRQSPTVNDLDDAALKQSSLVGGRLATCRGPRKQLVEELFREFTARLAVRSRLAAGSSQTLCDAIRIEPGHCLLTTVICGKDLRDEHPTGDDRVIDAIAMFIPQLITNSVNLGLRQKELQDK